MGIMNEFLGSLSGITQVHFEKLKYDATGKDGACGKLCSELRWLVVAKFWASGFIVSHKKIMEPRQVVYNLSKFCKRSMIANILVPISLYSVGYPK